MRCVAGVSLLFATVLSPACSGRPPNAVAVVQPHPVAVVQLQDQFMDCPAIFAEMQANVLKISDSAGEQGLKAFQNGRGGAGGHFTGPRWFGTASEEATDKEIRALQVRHEYLLTLVKQRRCDVPAPKRK
jgi:hypothetical protein